jgi:3-dehydroquinate synthetase
MELTSLLAVLKTLNLPHEIPVIRNVEAFRSALAADKKSEKGVVRFALPAGLGSTALNVEVPSSFINELLRRR